MIFAYIFMLNILSRLSSVLCLDVRVFHIKGTKLHGQPKFGSETIDFIMSKVTKHNLAFENLEFEELDVSKYTFRLGKEFSRS